MAKPALVLFSSLYPYPWQKTKATFNYQQYQALSDYYHIQYVVPVPWLTWFRYFFVILRQKDYPNVTYFPMFYIPGILRNFNSYFLMFSVFFSILPLFKLLRAKRVLASWAYPDAPVCAWLKPLARYQLFIQCLGSDVNVHQHFPKRRAMLSKAFKVADAVITVSKDLEEKVRAICPSANVKTVYNGVNFDRFSLSKVLAEPKSLIFIGNLIKTKGVFELLQAVKLLKDPDITLNIVGGGPELKALQDSAAALGITNQIQFHGRLAHEKVSELLHKSKMLVLPSYSEGVPNVIMESLACGIPVVATGVGGIPEVINKKNGILIASHQPEDIADGILQCMQLQWQPGEIRQSIAQYTWQNNSFELNRILS